MLQITAFHIDFSTLDIENGRVDLPPYGVNFVIQPILQQPVLEVKGVVLEEKQQRQPQERVSVRKGRR